MKKNTLNKSETMINADLTPLLQLAKNAHSNTSFSPEKRGTDSIAVHQAELNEDLQQIASYATTAQAIDQHEVQQERYATNYRRYYSAWLSAHGRCISSMITGPSNFPVRRAEKANRSEQNRYNDFRQWRLKALKSAKKALTPKLTAEVILKLAEHDLDVLERLQEKMKTANAIIRKGEDVTALLAEIGFSMADITKLLKPDYANQTGFRSWQLSNNNAEIKRRRQRIADLQQKQEAASVERFTEYPFNGGTVTIDREADRIQIAHDSKPDDATRQELKKNGFNWSPRNGCWQRKITEAAKYTTQRITQVQFS